MRIWESSFWKEQCFALTAETIIDEAVKLKYVGGTYANTRPTEFLCLVLKLLQIQPEKEIVMEYLRAEEFKCGARCVDEAEPTGTCAPSPSSTSASRSARSTSTTFSSRC